MWDYIKNSCAELSGTTDRRRWMSRLLMQSMGTAQCLRTRKWAGVSKCICILLICAVRGKQPPDERDISSPESGTKVGGKCIIKPLKNWEWCQLLANMEPEQHPALRARHLSCCRSSVFTGPTKQLLPRRCRGRGLEKGQGDSAPVSQPPLSSSLMPGALECTQNTPYPCDETHPTALQGTVLHPCSDLFFSSTIPVEEFGTINYRTSLIPGKLIDRIETHISVRKHLGEFCIIWDLICPLLLFHLYPSCHRLKIKK